MSSRRLSTRSLRDLIDLFERSHQAISDPDGQRLQGVPGWEIRARTSRSPAEWADWMDCVGFAGVYPAPCGDERVPVDLEEDEEPDRYRYRCPETFRRKFLPAADAAVYAVSVPKLLGAIAHLLGIPQALHHRFDRPALEGMLWPLGAARIGRAHTDVWLVRGLAVVVPEVFRHFHSPLLPDQGLVLSSGFPLPEFVSPPRNYRFATLQQVLVDEVSDPCLDRTLLQRILAAPADGTLRPVLPVHFDTYTHTLTIRSKSRPWVIKGARQAAAVRYLFEQAGQDRWVLPAAEILGAAYPDKKTARSFRMQNLFSGNLEWEDYIANPKKGYYGFRLD